MYNCIIIEDQLPAQRILMKYISEVSDLHLSGSFGSLDDAKNFLSTTHIDLIFLDIHLPMVSGLELFRTGEPIPPVILTTAFSEYGVQSYEFGVVDYLLKPFSFDRFLKALDKFRMLQSNNGRSKEIIFKSGHEHIRLNSADILYIKSDLDYTELHLRHTKFLSGHTLNFWQQELESYNFIRIHRSYLINFSSVTKIAGGQVFIDDEHSFPIGRVFKEEVTSKWRNQ